MALPIERIQCWIPGDEASMELPNHLILANHPPGIAYLRDCFRTPVWSRGSESSGPSSRDKDTRSLFPVAWIDQHAAKSTYIQSIYRRKNKPIYLLKYLQNEQIRCWIIKERGNCLIISTLGSIKKKGRLKFVWTGV